MKVPNKIVAAFAAAPLLVGLRVGEPFWTFRRSENGASSLDYAAVLLAFKSANVTDV